MRREEETQAALEAALVENKRLRAEIELLKNPPAGHSDPVPESASNDSGAFLCAPSASGIGEVRSEEHTSELQSPCNLVWRLLLEKKTHSHFAVERQRRPTPLREHTFGADDR